MNHPPSDNIVVTGMGIVSSLGAGVDVHREALRRGISGICPIASFDASPYYCRSAGECRALPGDTGRGPQLLLLALREVLANGRLDPRGENGALILGNTLGGMAFATDFYRARHHGERTKVAPLRRFLASEEAAAAAGIMEIRGPIHAISNACASGLNAIHLGAQYLRSGQCRYALVGGYEPLAEFTHAGFCALRALTPTVCRPFDRDRDGMTLGEGAGLLLLEREEEAARRGATPLARIAGYGESIDTCHLTKSSPEGHGPERAMRKALAGNDDVAFIVAHATATPANDDAEASAILRALGERAKEIPVTALKPIFGHALGAAGAIESIAAIIALRESLIPAILHHRNSSDGAREIDLITGDSRKVHGSSVMVNGFGFGGMNACLVFKKM